MRKLLSGLLLHSVGMFIVLLIFFFSVSEVNAQVVINEILPDPSTNESQDEWVELYNVGGVDVDVNGFILKDASDTHEMAIDGSKTNGSTVVTAHSWLVIYRRGDSDFSLNNTGPETIRLYTPSDLVNPVNTFTYNDSAKDKSWGRLPDGGNISLDKLVMSPGSANIAPSTPTPTPTESPTASPTASPSPTPTPTKTPPPKPTAKATPLVLSEETGSPPPANSEVLGLRSGLATLGPEAQVASNQTKKSFPILSWILILSGISLISYTAFRLFKNIKEGYNNESV